MNTPVIAPVGNGYTGLVLQAIMAATWLALLGLIGWEAKTLFIQAQDLSVIKVTISEQYSRESDKDNNLAQKIVELETRVQDLEDFADEMEEANESLEDALAALSQGGDLKEPVNYTYKKPVRSRSETRKEDVDDFKSKLYMQQQQTPNMPFFEKVDAQKR